MATTHTRHGQSGKTYNYTVHEIGANWNDVPGNYIYAKREGDGWSAKYIGQTESFKQRLPTHEEEGCAVQNGATHIHAHASGGVKTTRTAEESDLIAEHRPPRNQRR